MSASIEARMLAIADIGELPAEQCVGLIDQTAVACLRVRLEREGLQTPIWVRRNGNAAKDRWSVIAGRHRLLAARQLGWTEIAAEERADPKSDTDTLRRLQLTENLDRRTLRPIEHACFVMDRWREAAAGIVPEGPHTQPAAAARARWTAWEAVSHAPSAAIRKTDEATAAACGKSDRWVRDYRKIFTQIVAGLPNDFAALNATELGASLDAMKYVSGLPENKRKVAAAAIIAAPDATSLREVLVKAGVEESNGNRTDPNQPDAAFMAALSKLKGVRRRVALFALAGELTPTDALGMVGVFKKRGLLA